MKKRIIIISVALAVEFAIILTICGVNGVLTTSMPAKDVTRFLCDGFFVSGAIGLGVGGLMWTTKMGAFDGFGYTLSRWKESLFKNRRDWHAQEKYSEYKEKQAEKRKKIRISEMLIIGGASVVVAAILLIVYNFAF